MRGDEQHLYEVSMSEDCTRSEVRGWDADKTWSACTTHYSPLVKAAVQLGCCAVVQARAAARRRRASTSAR